MAERSTFLTLFIKSGMSTICHLLQLASRPEILCEAPPEDLLFKAEVLKLGRQTGAARRPHFLI